MNGLTAKFVHRISTDVQLRTKIVANESILTEYLESICNVVITVITGKKHTAKIEQTIIRVEIKRFSFSIRSLSVLKVASFVSTRERTSLRCRLREIYVARYSD